MPGMGGMPSSQYPRSTGRPQPAPGINTPQQFGQNQRVPTPQQFAMQKPPQKPRSGKPAPWKAIIAGACAALLIGIGIWGVQNALASKEPSGGGGGGSATTSTREPGETTSSPSSTPNQTPEVTDTGNGATKVTFNEPVRSELTNHWWRGELTVTEPTTVMFFVSTYGDADLWLSVFHGDLYWSNENRPQVLSTFTTNPTDPALVARLEPGTYQIQLNGTGYTDSSFMLETFAATDISTGETPLAGEGLGADEGWRAHFLSFEVPMAGEWEFDVVAQSGDLTMDVVGLQSGLPSSSSGSPLGAGSEKDPNIVKNLDAETALVIVQEETFQPFDATLTVKAP